MTKLKKSEDGEFKGVMKIFLVEFFLRILQDACEYAVLRMPSLIFVSLTVFLLSLCLLAAVIVPNGMCVYIF